MKAYEYYYKRSGGSENDEGVVFANSENEAREILNRWFYYRIPREELDKFILTEIDEEVVVFSGSRWEEILLDDFITELTDY